MDKTPHLELGAGLLSSLDWGNGVIRPIGVSEGLLSSRTKDRRLERSIGGTLANEAARKLAMRGGDGV